MNIAKLTRALQGLASASSELADVCDREGLGLAAFWRSVSSESSALLTSGRFDKAALDHIVRDVVSTFSYQPGGFMELYIVRKDPNEQERENIAFERIRGAVRAAAGNVKEAAEDGEVNPLHIRHALVDLETALLELGMTNDATTARSILNGPALAGDAVLAFGDAVLSHSNPANLRSLEPLVRVLKAALRPAGTE